MVAANAHKAIERLADLLGGMLAGCDPGRHAQSLHASAGDPIRTIRQIRAANNDGIKSHSLPLPFSRSTNHDVH